MKKTDFRDCVFPSVLRNRSLTESVSDPSYHAKTYIYIPKMSFRPFMSIPNVI